MREKNGFTLIELLAIIVILAIIAVITVPIILNVIENSRKGAAIDSAIGYKDSIQKSIITDLSLNPDMILPTGTYVLNSSGSLVNESDTINPNVKGTVPEEFSWVELLKGNVTAYSLKLGDYVVTKYEDTEPTAEKNGEVKSQPIIVAGTTKPDGYKYLTTPVEVLYNPKTNQICDTNGGSTPGTMSDCMKWYAYSSKDGVVNMILDHNIANGIMWYDELNQQGPQTALASLKNITDSADWKTTVIGDYATYTGNVTAQNINYSGYKARLITAQEIAYITGNDSWNEKSSSSSYFYFGSLNTTGYSSQNATQKAKQESYGWLFANLYNCGSNGCGASNNSTVESGNYGYWSSSPYAGGPYHAWSVNYDGTLGYSDANSTYYGVRPVITVSTSIVFPQ